MKKFKWTDKQKEAIRLFQSPARYVLLYGGGRAAKTFACMAFIISRALAVGRDYKGKQITQLVCRLHGTDVMAKLYYQEWQAVLSLVYPGLEKRIFFNKAERRATFPNGSVIRFTGLDDGKGFEAVLGDDLLTCFFNECSEIPYAAFTTAMTRLSQQCQLKPKFLLDMNPTHSKWWVYRLFIEHVWPSHQACMPMSDFDQRNFVSLLMNPTDNLENLPPDYVEMLKNAPPDTRRRFLYGQFSEVTEDAVYERYIMDARLEGRICKLFCEPNYPVHAVFDVGLRDKTAIWIVQYLPDRILFLDFIHGVKTPLIDFIFEIYRRGWRPKTIILPHDVKRRNAVNLQSGLDIIFRFKEECNNPEMDFYPEVLPKRDKAAGIDLARTLFHFCYFDTEKCAEGIDALGNYKFKFNEFTGDYEREPAHTWASHGADAFRYAVESYRQYPVEKIKPVRDLSKVYFDDIFPGRVSSQGATLRDLRQYGYGDR